MLFGIADADQDSAELIIGLRDMVLLPKLGEDGTRHAIQVRSDFFDQVGTQVHHLIDESGERFDAGEAFNGLGAFLRHRVKRAQLGVANAYEQIVRQHKPERRRRVIQIALV
jgi:hypothetical protein